MESRQLALSLTLAPRVSGKSRCRSSIKLKARVFQLRVHPRSPPPAEAPAAPKNQVEPIDYTYSSRSAMPGGSGGPRRGDLPKNISK